jgi:hypothetical protein
MLHQVATLPNGTKVEQFIQSQKDDVGLVRSESPATRTQREMDHAHLQLAAGRKCFNDIGVLMSRSASHSYRSATEGSTFIALRAGK